MPRTLPGKPVKWTPKGLSDAQDGTNAFPGAMTSLRNLIPSPTTAGAWVCRPASLELTGFSGFTSPAQGNALLQVGSIVYGMIAETTGTYSGKDVPFAYDIKTSDFLPVSIPGGAASLPASPADTGDWVPPVMCQIGPRIIITHPGYAGGSDPYFGWLDVSDFSDATVTGDTNGNTTINVLSKDVLIEGWQPGMTISSSAGDIPANTTIVSLSEGTLDLNTTGTFNGTNEITAVSSTTGVVPGCSVNVNGQPVALVQSVGNGTITMNQAVDVVGSGLGVNFSGATSITISQAATGSNSGVTLTVAGGTSGAPLYGAGNTNVNPLPAVPVSVGEFNGRAYYAVPGNGMKFSDSLVPCNITFASQGLNPANGVDVTAFGGLGLWQTTGGVLQALIAFQGDAQMQQITGDPATSNLAMSPIGAGVGTLAPNTICQTEVGLAFISSDGFRILGFSGQISDPIGANGKGVCFPFLSAINPSRMCAAYNQNVFRVSVQNGEAPGQPIQEYWYDFGLKVWSGPHDFPAALIEAYQGTPDHGFTMFAAGVDAKLWSSAVTPSVSDSYIENGNQMTWEFQTVLLPDTAGMCENKVVVTTFSAALGNDQAVTVIAMDEDDGVMDQLTLYGPAAPQTTWGAFTWGASPWGGPGSYLYQYPLAWHAPLIFKQMSLQFNGNSALGTVLGNINMQIEQLGYVTQAPYPSLPMVPVPAADVLIGDGQILTGDGDVLLSE